MGTVLGKSDKPQLPEKYGELYKILGFRKRKIKQWYAAFIKQCPNGYMGIDDFTVLYKARQNKLSHFAELDDPYITHLCTNYVFNTLDINGDNRLDFEEYANGLAMISQGKKDDKLRWVFDMIDTDKSGYLTHDELMELLVSVQYGSSEDGDPINADKLLMVCEMEAERMIAMMDLDNDNQITFEEFKKTASNDPVVMNLLSRM